MFKKLTIILVLIMFILSAVPVYAADHHQADVQGPVIYTRDIVVTEAGGIYQVGFTTIKFPKHFIDRLPIVIHVEVSSVDGVPGIQFNPDIPSFNKDVIIHVDAYNGLLYDRTLGKNVRQRIRQQNLKVSHFSRYAFS